MSNRFDFSSAPTAAPKPSRFDFGAAPAAPKERYDFGTPKSSAPPAAGHIDGLIESYANKYRVPVEFARKIAGIETGGSADAQHVTSTAGARGYFQLMPGTFKEMAVGNDITDPEQNIHAGIKYLAQNLSKYGGDWVKTAGAYNAGPGAMDAYLHVPGTKLPDETTAYMSKVAYAKTEYDNAHNPPSPTGYHPPKIKPPVLPHEQQQAGVDPLAMLRDRGLLGAKGPLDEALRGAEKHLWDAIHTPLNVVDHILGAPERFVSAALLGAGNGSHGNPAEDLVRGVQAGIKTATHPNDEALQKKNVAETLHAIGMIPGLQQAGNLTDAALRKLPEKIGNVPVRGPAQLGIKLMEIQGAQAIVDPVTYVPIVGELRLASKAAKAYEEMRAVHGMSGVWAAGHTAAQTVGKTALNRGKAIFGRRPELDPFLDHVGKAGRLGIEQRTQTKYVQPQRVEDEKFLVDHAAELRAMKTGEDGNYVIPDFLKQKMLSEPYRFGTDEMRERALELGYQPAAKEAAEAPANLLDYNVREDYMTMIRPRKADPAADSAFGRFTTTYKDGKAAFEKRRRGEETRRFNEDELPGVIENRLSLGRMFVQRRMTDRDTEAFLGEYGGWKGTGGVDVSRLTHQSSDAIVKLGEGSDINLSEISPFRGLGKLGSQSVMGNPLPHGLRNVGELAYLGGGPRAFSRGIYHAGKGLDERSIARLTEMGLDPGYTRSIQGPLKHLGDKMYDAGGATKLAAQAGHAYIHSGQVTLDRLELGFRQALLEHYDRIHGPSKNMADEFMKADLVRRDLGDYRNVSLFVKALQALGGPFVAFRVGTVPAATGRALRSNPQRVEAFARAQQNLEQQTPGPGELNLGGPVEDFAKSTLSPVDYFENPATMGVVGDAYQHLTRIKGGQGTSLEGLEAQTAREYIPGVGIGESLLPLAGGPTLPFGEVPGVSPLHSALVQAFGSYFKRKPSKKARSRAFKNFEKTK